MKQTHTKNTHWKSLAILLLLPLTASANHGVEALGEVIEMVMGLGFFSLFLIVPLIYILSKRSIHLVIRVIAGILLLPAVILAIIGLLLFISNLN